MRFPKAVLQSRAGREAIRIIDRLREAGFFAVLAGGCVRDGLLGRVPKDFDVATEATPDAVQQVFGRHRTVAFGASFGVIGVLPPLDADASGEGGDAPTEVATFRADGNYSDGRRPDHVTYGTARADAERRDFTINGLFYDPRDDQVLDYVGGIADLHAMHLRTIGDADRRFDEDKLRMLRAVRFVTTLNLSVEESTMVAIKTYADTLEVVSGERIGAEMRKVIAHPGAVVGLRLLVQTGLHRQVWPELATIDFDILQTAYQDMKALSFESGMATVLALRHEQPVDAEQNLRRIASTWRLATAEQRAITAAIRLAPVIMACHCLPWSQLQPILTDRDIEVIMSVASALHRHVIAPASGGTSTAGDPAAGVRRAMRELERPPESLDPPPLLTGDDLKTAGFSPGPHFRAWLSEVRRRQLDDQMQTSAEALEWIRSQVQKRQ